MQSWYIFKLTVLILLIIILQSLPTTAEDLYFTILHTNDEHSSLVPRRPLSWYGQHPLDMTVGGFSRLATAVHEIRDQKQQGEEPLLLLSGGDYLGGAPYAWLILKGMAKELEIMQEIGYDVITIGNHEFDYGPDILAQYLQRAGYPEANERTVLLSTNVKPPEHHLLQEVGIKKTHREELENGLVIGFLGLLGLQAQSYAPDTGDVVFINPYAAAREAVASLQEESVDIIIAITHSGLEEDRELARSVPGIHIIVGGHCHTALHEVEIVQETIILQAGSLLEYLGVLELAYNRGEDTLHIRNEENNTPFLIPLDDRYLEDPTIEERIQGATEEMDGWMEELTGGQFSHLFEEIVYTDFPLSHSSTLQEMPFGNFLTDAIRFMAGEKLGEPVDFALQADGLIRGSLIPKESPLERGRITLYDLAELSSIGRGFDNSPGNSLSAFYLSGEEVWRLLEVNVFLSHYLDKNYFFQFSGLRYQYDPRRIIYFTIPIRKTPFPSARAVLQADQYVGVGPQKVDDTDYQPLEKSDEDLYLVVCDTSLLSFLPMVGEVLPKLMIKPRDEKGVPYERLEDTVIQVEGREYKVWQALLEYASQQPQNEMGRPQIPPYYAETHHRILTTRGIPFVTWPLLGLLLLTAGVLLF